MKIVTPPLVVNEGDAFKNDILERESFGKILTNIVELSGSGLVISIDGKWGVGKTTFVKMWQGLLSERGIPNLYIDAFSDDYIDNAFLLIASSITEYANKHTNTKGRETISELKKKSIKVGKRLLSLSARIGVKAATLGLIKDEDFEELKGIRDEITKGLSNIVEDCIEDLLSEHSENTELIRSYKILLSSLPGLMNSSCGSLVIIVDELDRCKPTFAIEIIERIKHLFSVENVVFVLVMNKDQIVRSIKHVYGNEIDAHTYIQKFIHLETSLSKAIREQGTSDLEKYSKKLQQLHEIDAWGRNDSAIECTEILARYFNLSLRQLEKVYANLVILYCSSKDNEYINPPIAAFLSVVKVINPDVFIRLLHSKILYQDMIEELKLDGFEGKGKTRMIVNWLRYALLPQEEWERLPDEHKSYITHGRLSLMDISKDRLIPIFAQLLNMFVVN
jgi:hypothetical protein